MGQSSQSVTLKPNVVPEPSYRQAGSRTSIVLDSFGPRPGQRAACSAECDFAQAAADDARTAGKGRALTRVRIQTFFSS